MATDPARGRARSFVLSFGVAWMILAGSVFSAFADEPLPASYLIRPLIVATVAAVLMGIVALPLGRYGSPVVAATALLLAAPMLPVVLSAVALVLGLVYLRRRGRGFLRGDGPAVILAASFFILGVVRAVPLIEVWPAERPARQAGPPIYVILLDGYPRWDSLAAEGIDIRPFIEDLEARGFDHYPEATSLHTSTNRSLLAMLTAEAVSDEPGTVPEAREIRRRLLVPPGFVAVDPPIGHVTLGPGRHFDPGGLNDFDAYLLGRSALGLLAPDVGWGFLLGDLRDRLDRTLGFLETATERRILAHLMVPHPPFMFGLDGSSEAPRWCWPECGLFDSYSESLSVTPGAWWTGMASQLDHVNARLVESVDAILAAHPDSVIVLFSDHGGRYSVEDEEEKHRSFLAARTPGNPGLFAAAPRPDTVIRALLEAYP